MMRIASVLCGLAGLTLAISAQAGTAPPPPPYEGVYQPQGVDEIGMWREADEEERGLAESPQVIRDERLTTYLQSVLCRSVGQDRCQAARIYVVRFPVFGASMTPNGTMRVYSGLLLRMRNEAELAAVLGHEFGHFERRHSLNSFKMGRTGRDILAWSGVLTSMFPSYETRRAYQDLRVSVLGNLYRYDRNQEREADLLGLGYLNASNLRPQAAAEVWQNLMGELEASARVRGLNKPNFKAIAFTASHPPDGERAEYLGELARIEGAARDDGAARYRQALAPWLSQFLEDQVKLNDFGGTEYIIASLAADGGWTAELWFARGELFRTRGNQRDLVFAGDFYAEAIKLDPLMAEAHRGLGLALLKTGQREAGQDALRRYLELKPDAADASMIGMMLPKEGTPQ